MRPAEFRETPISPFGDPLFNIGCSSTTTRNDRWLRKVVHPRINQLINVDKGIFIVEIRPGHNRVEFTVDAFDTAEQVFDHLRVIAELIR